MDCNSEGANALLTIGITKNQIIALRTKDMKKTTALFLALVMSLLTLQVSAQMYIVGDGPFGGWNPAGGVRMNAKADGTYYLTTTVSGKVYFVFADGLWLAIQAFPLLPTIG